MSSVIQNAIPGLREVRAPLAAGYTLAIAVWLIGENWAKKSGIEFDSIHGLAERIGRPSVLIACSFVVYLIGTQLVRFSNYVFQLSTVPIETSTSPVRRGISSFRSFTNDTELAGLYDRVDARVYSEARKAPPKDIDNLVGEATGVHETDDKGFHPLTRQVTSEAKGQGLDPRILLMSTEVYNEVSRLRSEAELRSSVVLPGALLLFAVLFDSNAPVLIEVAGVCAGTALLTLLAFDALNQRTKAQRIVLRLVADGTIGTPTLDQISMLQD